MTTHQQERRCGCGTRLARDNRGLRCNACTKKARNTRVQPPSVPADFWRDPAMREALAACDMGKVMRAFRTHPFHGRDISQDVAAGWVGVTQPRLSKIENGDRLTNITKLMHWAHALRIPADLLWFRMPSASPGPSGVPAVMRQDEPRALPVHTKTVIGSVLLPVVVAG